MAQALSHMVPILLQYEPGLRGQARESHFYHTGNDCLAVCVSVSPTDYESYKPSIIHSATGKLELGQHRGRSRQNAEFQVRRSGRKRENSEMSQTISQPVKTCCIYQVWYGSQTRGSVFVLGPGPGLCLVLPEHLLEHYAPPPPPHSHLMIGVLFRDQEGRSCAPEEAGKKVRFYKKKRAVRVRFPILTQGKEETQKFQPRGSGWAPGPVPSAPASSLFLQLASWDYTTHTNFIPHAAVSH